MHLFNTILLQLANASPSTDVDYKLLMTWVSALSGAIIGGAITIWYKRAEIKNLLESLKLQSENLELQKANFKETISNNELKIKAELVRLEDLNRQYKLNLQKFDFEHLSKVLDFAGDSNGKVKMLKDFSAVLEKYKPNLPNWIIDESEYQEYIVNHIFYELEFISLEINKLLSKYPTVFNTLHNDFKSVSSEAKYLLGYADEISSYHEEIDNESIINQMSSSLLKLHENFNELLLKMQQEFLELDSLKKEYIRSQFKSRVQEAK
jgi:hypothetical protein